MSVATAIEDLQERVGEAFTAVEEKGGTLPVSKTTHTLPAAIRSITPKPNVEAYSFTWLTTKSFVVPAISVCDFKRVRGLEGCFRGCSSLSSLTLPDGFGFAATTLENCFFSCSSLVSLTLPDGFGSAATNIEGCFRACSSLTSLTLPAGFGVAVTSVFDCFNGCSSLTSLTLPNGFGSSATDAFACFSRCYALVTISGDPNFKVSISFSSCTKLTHDSLMVVINGLQTVTTKQTLTLGATNLAKLTDEEKAIATNKGWTLE